MKDKNRGLIIFEPLRNPVVVNRFRYILMKASILFFLALPYFFVRRSWGSICWIIAVINYEDMKGFGSGWRNSFDKLKSTITKIGFVALYIRLKPSTMAIINTYFLFFISIFELR